jgi:hypothetical protein
VGRIGNPSYKTLSRASRIVMKTTRSNTTPDTGAQWAAGSRSRFIETATAMRPGLLVNFGSYPNAEVERRIL